MHWIYRAAPYAWLASGGAKGLGLSALILPVIFGLAALFNVLGFPSIGNFFSILFGGIILGGLWLILIILPFAVGAQTAGIPGAIVVGGGLWGFVLVTMLGPTGKAIVGYSILGLLGLGAAGFIWLCVYCYREAAREEREAKAKAKALEARR